MTKGKISGILSEPELCPIQGQVFLVDWPTLAAVDELEGHPDWYIREEAEIVLHSGQQLTAWMDFNPAPRGRLVPGGDFLSGPQPGG